MNNPEEIRKHTQICLYFDYYGKLLTPRRQQILQMSFENDMSLAEIADALGTSRQAVHDNIQQAVAQLENYETELGMVQKDQRLIHKIDQLLTEIPVRQNQTLADSLRRLRADIL